MDLDKTTSDRKVVLRLNNTFSPRSPFSYASENLLAHSQSEKREGIDIPDAASEQVLDVSAKANIQRAATIEQMGYLCLSVFRPLIYKKVFNTSNTPFSA